MSLPVDHDALIAKIIGADVTEPGLKLDDGKLDYSLIDPAAEAEFVAVLTFGGVKYERGNWRFVKGARERYTAALRRHLAAWQMGEELDPETGLHHLACASCCVHFLLGIALDSAAPRGRELRRSLPERLAAALVTARRIRAEREAKTQQNVALKKSARVTRRKRGRS